MRDMITTYPSSWKRNYQISIRYAMKLFLSNRDQSVLPRDLVHDAYVYWLEQKNEDLFLKKQGEIAKIIKNLFFSRSSRQNWYFRGEIHPKSFSEDLISGLPKENQSQARESLFYKWGGGFATQSFEGEDTVAHFKKHLNPFDIKVLSLKEEGYKNNEIEVLVNRSNPIVTGSIKKIKKKMKDLLLNPFNCSKVKVLQKISRKSYEANKAAYDADFEMGEYAEYNEYYVLLTSKKNPKEGLLIKEQVRD